MMQASRLKQAREESDRQRDHEKSMSWTKMGQGMLQDVGQGLIGLGGEYVSGQMPWKVESRERTKWAGELKASQALADDAQKRYYDMREGGYEPGHPDLVAAQQEYIGSVTRTMALRKMQSGQPSAPLAPTPLAAPVAPPQSSPRPAAPVAPPVSPLRTFHDAEEARVMAQGDPSDPLAWQLRQPVGYTPVPKTAAETQPTLSSTVPGMLQGGFRRGEKSPPPKPDPLAQSKGGANIPTVSPEIRREASGDRGPAPAPKAAPAPTPTLRRRDAHLMRDPLATAAKVQQKRQAPGRLEAGWQLRQKRAKAKAEAQSRAELLRFGRKKTVQPRTKHGRRTIITGPGLGPKGKYHGAEVESESRRSGGSRGSKAAKALKKPPSRPTPRTPQAKRRHEVENTLAVEMGLTHGGDDFRRLAALHKKKPSTLSKEEKKFLATPEGAGLAKKAYELTQRFSPKLNNKDWNQKQWVADIKAEHTAGAEVKKTFQIEAEERMETIAIAADSRRGLTAEQKKEVRDARDAVQAAIRKAKNKKEAMKALKTFANRIKFATAVTKAGEYTFDKSAATKLLKGIDEERAGMTTPQTQTPAPPAMIPNPKYAAWEKTVNVIKAKLANTPGDEAAKKALKTTMSQKPPKTVPE
tara:strand:+ start:2612 stop:4525 length:1914 start_codon:yes stop_codon:yes gene_type:complete